jgi:hypothetical protein
MLATRRWRMHIALIGQYSVASFALASDGHSGTVVTDPAVVAQTQLASPPS